MTEEEKEFLAKPNLDTWMNLDKSQRGNLTYQHAMFVDTPFPSKTTLIKGLPEISDKIKEAALERWMLSLDDATKMSVNLSKFSDVELAGLKYMLESWDVERLKQFKKQLESKKITGDKL